VLHGEKERPDVHRQVVLEGLRIGVGDRVRRGSEAGVADDAVDPRVAFERRLDERSTASSGRLRHRSERLEAPFHGHRTVAPFVVVRHAANGVAPHCPGDAVGIPNAIDATGGVPAGAAPSARPRAFTCTFRVPGSLLVCTFALTMPLDADLSRY